jgi:hypothetical protein
LPSQQRILTEQLPELVLKFIESDRRQFQLPRADLVVIWARFVSHRISEAVVSKAPGNIYIHRGGMKEIKIFLQNWNCKNNPKVTGGK